MDLSSKMLGKAREKVPAGVFVHADLLRGRPRKLDIIFDRVVSAYTFHHFDLNKKVELLESIVSGYLTPGGKVVIGDVSFPSVRIREMTRGRSVDRWDEDEFYWAADETTEACRAAGLKVEYRQVSFCGGVFVVTGQ